MKLASKNLVGYVIAIGVLVGLAYFVQTDTRRVDGISMLPTLEGGDLVVIQPVPFDQVHVGDIIVYSGLCSYSGDSVIHRVIAVLPGGLETKGDNNYANDQAGQIATSLITPQCLVGKVVFVVPYVEIIAYLIDQQQLPSWVNYVPAAFILLIVVFLLLEEGDEKKSKGGTQAESAPQKAEPSS